MTSLSNKLIIYVVFLFVAFFLHMLKASICGRQQQQQGMILSPLSSLQQRCSSSSASPSSSKNNQSFTDSSPNPSKTGAGIGNVENKMLPTADETKTFRHCQYPRTTSLIGAPMTYGQPFVGTVRYVVIFYNAIAKQDVWLSDLFTYLPMSECIYKFPPFLTNTSFSVVIMHTYNIIIGFRTTIIT